MKSGYSDFYYLFQNNFTFISELLGSPKNFYVNNKNSRNQAFILNGFAEIFYCGTDTPRDIYNHFYLDSQILRKHNPLLPNPEINGKLHYALMKSSMEHILDGGSPETTPNLFDVVSQLAIHSDEVYKKSGLSRWALSLPEALIIMEAFGMKINNKDDLFYNEVNGEYDIWRTATGEKEYQVWPYFDGMEMTDIDQDYINWLFDDPNDISFEWDGKVDQNKAQWWLNYLGSRNQQFDYVGLDPRVADIKVEFIRTYDSENNVWITEPHYSQIRPRDPYYGPLTRPNLSYIYFHPEAEGAMTDELNYYSYQGVDWEEFSTQGSILGWLIAHNEIDKIEAFLGYEEAFFAPFIEALKNSQGTNPNS